MANSLETLYTDVEMNLKIVQTAAVLEIIHAAIGFVKSPVMTTFMQGTPPPPSLSLSLSGHRAARPPPSRIPGLIPPVVDVVGTQCFRVCGPCGP